MNFTKKELSSLMLPPKGKRHYYYDNKTRGLVVCINPTGTKTFQVYRKINGRPERITIGRLPDLTIEQARNKASEINSMLSRGVNPNEVKRKDREEKKLGTLFDYYLEHHAKKHKKSWKEDQSQYNRYLTHWRNRRLSHISTKDIQKLHSYIGDHHGTYAANRLLALIHAMLNHGQHWGFCGTNPAHSIKKFKEKSRKRFLQSAELPKFFESLSIEPNTTARDYILISLLTGARKNNVLSMRWEQINFLECTWHILDTKNGSSHLVPLVSQAIKILKNRRKQNQSEWVFPGNGKTGHLVEPKLAWKRILARAGINDLRLHDLRRSLGSWQAATGASLSIIGKSLAHKNVSTTVIYGRLNIDPVRESMNKATSAMFQFYSDNRFKKKREII